MADNDKVQFENLKNKQNKLVKNIAKAPISKEVPKEKIKFEEKKNDKTEIKEEKEIETKKVEEKKNEVVKTIPKIKKSEAVINGKSLPISLKHSVAIGKFIKNKKINQAILNLQRVEKKQLAIPMAGEIGHKKGKRLDGKGMAGGKYPVNAAGVFIKLLKTLNGNAIVNGMELENAKITEVIANKSPKQIHRGGRTQFKRTHVSIKVKEIGEKN